MSMPQADPGGSAEPKRQKKDEVTLHNVDLNALPHGFKASISSAQDSLVLTQNLHAVEAVVAKYHQAVVLYRDLLIKQAAAQSKLEARLEASLTSATSSQLLEHRTAHTHTYIWTWRRPRALLSAWPARQRVPRNSLASIAPD